MCVFDLPSSIRTETTSNPSFSVTRSPLRLQGLFSEVWSPLPCPHGMWSCFTAHRLHHSFLLETGQGWGCTGVP